MFRVAGAVGGAISTLALIRATTVKANQNERQATGDAGRTNWKMDFKEAHARSLGRDTPSFPVTAEQYHQKGNFKRPATATRHLILVRNGQEGEEKEEEDDEGGLTSLGRKQAALAGRRLYDLGMPYTKIVHSGSRRSAETAHIIASYLLYIRREYDGDLRADRMSAREKSKEISQLVEAAVDKYLGVAKSQQVGDSFVVLVCGEDVIKGLLCRSMGLPMDWAPRLLLYHASVSILAVSPDGDVTIKAVGDTGYMTKDIMTLNKLESQN